MTAWAFTEKEKKNRKYKIQQHLANNYLESSRIDSISVPLNWPLQYIWSHLLSKRLRKGGNIL